MAATSVVKSTKLVLVMEDGLTPSGTTKYKRATYNNVKSTASDDGVVPA